MGVSELYPAQQDLRRPRDGGRVDPVVPIQIAARPGLTEVVHAERLLRYPERGPDEGERVRVAVEHRDDGYAFLIGAHEIFEIWTRVSQTAIEAVGARHRENARQDAALAERALRRDRLGNGDTGGKEADRVHLGIPARLAPRVHQPVGPAQHV